MIRWDRERIFWLFFFLFWLAFFWRGWLVLSYTKLWELSRMIGEKREVQLQVLHPTGEIRSLLQLKTLIQSSPFADSPVAIQAPLRDKDLPQAHDASILRAILYPWPVYRNALDRSEYALVVRVRATDSATLSVENQDGYAWWCSPQSDESCPCLDGEKSEKEILCWYMP